MRIIITRPSEDAGPLATKLEAMGHKAILMPLIEIVARTNVEIPNRTYQLICLTSANGVRAIQNTAELQRFPVIAVGRQSMLAAQSSGFPNVIMKGGDVLGLVKYIAENVQQSGGPILYLSGSETSGDLEGRLKLLGYDVDRLITYDAQPAPISSEVINADAVMLYSPRTAKLWRQNIENLKIDISHMQHICLSANVASNLPQTWQKRIATEPTENAILQVLD